MLAQHDAPIIAIATAPGRGAVGIVRISGKQLLEFSQALCGRKLEARQATYLPINDAQGVPIDHVLAPVGGAAEVRIGERAGSDHLPLMAAIKLPPE